MYRIVFYETPRGEKPAEEFLIGLPQRARAKTDRAVEYLRLLGPTMPRPYADTLRGPIRELRIRFGHLQCRILYFFAGDLAVLTQGFLKKTDAVPEVEIERAFRRMNDWVKRRGSES